MKNTLFPVFLKTETAHFLIVGGGNIGLEKTETLLKQNPEINITIVGTIIYPFLKEVIQKYSNIKSFERPFEEKDLDEKDYIIIGTDNPAKNLEIRELAKTKGIKVNAADQPALCDFYLGSIIQKGYLKIAISTNGKSPVLARRMREYFEEAIPDDLDETIENLNAFRNQHKGNFQEKLADLNQVTRGLSAKKPKKTYKKTAIQIVVLIIVFVLGILVSKWIK